MLSHIRQGMLTTLRIKNLALVPDLTIELEPGYNAITGETGAGKSLLIGALNMVLGGRADRSLIRHGADQGAVEAVFEIGRIRDQIAQVIEPAGIEGCADDQLVLKRVLTSAGANRQFVNGSPTSLALLARLGDLLVDIHGPHDHQSLLQNSQQLAMLDAFGDLEQSRGHYEQWVREYHQLQDQRAALVVDERTFAQQLDLLRFQVQEIQAARLQAGEELGLEEEFNRARNAARLAELCQNALECLGGEEQSIEHQTAILGRFLQELKRLDPTVAALTDTLDQMTELLRELRAGINRYADRIEVEPTRLQQIEQRLDLLHGLRRKYGARVEDVIAYGHEAEAKLAQWEKRDEEAARLEAALHSVREKIWESGQGLSRQRVSAGTSLARAVTAQLADLGFRQSHFAISLSALTREDFLKQAPPRQGLDQVEFIFAPNPGEPPRPLKAIASSGELARVMLALKTVLAVQDSIPVLIFDEVDSNVGGETASAVGEKMRQIGRKRQVLCVTHLAPVAACAVVHFMAIKQSKGQRTTTEIRRLAETERVAEIARMLGGPSEAARQHAHALLDKEQRRG
jgi:DNA repair protein RecN (Recombination protein N)